MEQKQKCLFKSVKIWLQHKSPEWENDEDMSVSSKSRPSVLLKFEFVSLRPPKPSQIIVVIFKH